MNNKEVNKTYYGGCLCGSIRYQTSGIPVVVAHCHCEDCQRISGAGHTTGAMFSITDVKFTGDISEYTLKANNGNNVTRGFCSNCGSPIFGRNNAASDYLTISLGTFDNSSDFEPQVVIFTRNKKPWDLVDDSLPAFKTQPDWKPADGI